MSDNIDRRIVEMRFDNQDFEKNVGKTLISLETLQEALQGLDQQQAIDGVKKGLLSLGQAAGSIKTDNISENVEQISNRFSTLGIIGTAVLQSIGYKVAELGFALKDKLLAPLNYIKQGGLTRAFNLEQANFQLSGLGIEKNDTAGYYTEVMDAVLGTAYSYDVAAKAASQLAASNIGVTEKTKTMLNGQEKATKYMTGDMTKAILGIAGVASMTGSSFEDISQVFTRVAGQGKVMSNDLNSISARGLNAAATLANYLGKTEAEVRDMVTKGKIDFNTFSAAMTEAFGAHAKDSTKTFTGALEDVKAALARIGADFYGPALTGARDMLNSITPLVDVIHDKIQWALDDSGSLMSKYSKKISGFLDVISISGSTIGDTFDKNFVPAVSIVKNGASTITEALAEMEHGSEEAFSFLGKKLGVTADQAKKMAEEGKVSFLDWAAAMTEFSSSGKEGAAEVKSYLADLSAEMRRYENVADNLGITQDMMAGAFERTANIVGTDVDKVYEAVGEKLGKTGEELKQTVRDGELSLTDFRNALNELVKDGAITDSQFHSIIDVMDHFILSDDRLISRIKNAQIVWGGLTATLSILKQILGSVGGIALSLLAKLAPAGHQVLEWLQAFNLWIMEVEAGTNNAGSVLKAFEEKLKSLGDALSTVNEKSSSARAILKEFLNGLAEKLVGLKILDGLKSKISDLFKILGDSIKSLNLDKITDFLSLAIKGGLLWNLYKMITKIGNGVRKTGLSYYLFGETFDQFRLYIIDLQNTIKYDHILRLAKAVAILAASMFVMASINPSRLMSAGAAMAFLIDELSMASNWIGASQISIFNKSTLIQLGTSLALLAGAVKILSTIDTAGMARGLVAIKVLFAELGKFMALLGSKEFAVAGPQMKRIAKSMKTIAVALILLCIPIKVLGSMDLPSLAKGLGGVAGALLIFAGFFKLLNSKVIGTTAPRISSIAKSLLIFAFALDLLVIPIKVLGGMNIKELGKGLLGIGGALLIFAGFFALLNSKVIGTTAPRISSIAKSLLIFAIALNFLAIPIKLLGSMGIKELGKGLGAVAIALLEFVGFAALMKTVGMSGKDMLAVSATMIIMATAINGIAIALAILSSFDAGPGLSALFGALLILAVAVKAMNGSIMGAAALIVVAGALMMLAPAIAMLSALDIGGVLVGLIGLAGAIVILGGAAIVLAACWPIFLTGAAILALFGVGVLALGAGITMLAAAFAVGITPIINGVIALSEALPMVLKNLGEAIGVFLEVLVEQAPQFLALLESLFDVLMTAAAEYIPRVANLGLELMVALLTAIESKIGDIVTLAARIVYNFLMALGEQAPALAEAGFNLVVQFLNGIADAIANNGPQIIVAVESILLAIIETIASAIPGFGKYAAGAIEKFRQGLVSGKSGAEKAAKATSEGVGKNLKISDKSVKEFKKPITDLNKTIENGAKDAAKKAGKLSDDTGKKLKIKDQTSNGSNAVRGIISGMDSQLPALRNKADQVATLVDKVIRKRNEIKSPSRVLARTGKYLMMGLINGLDALTPEYQNRANSISTMLIDSLNSANYFNGMEPVITPKFGSADLSSLSSTISFSLDTRRKEDKQMQEYIGALTSSLNSMIESANENQITPEQIYDAVRQGASQAEIKGITLNGRELKRGLRDMGVVTR